jgi:ubiquinone biosynthesis protein
MASALANLFRLARAGVVLSEHGARFLPPEMPVPLALRLARAATWPLRLLRWPFRAGRQPSQKGAPIAAALTELGPSYIKLGQFLATRRDLIDAKLAADLSTLQDRLPPFSMAEARRTIAEALGGRAEDHFEELGPPVAAASIAQVHKARVSGPQGARTVAVKILRPGIEARFARDLDSFGFAARQIERVLAPVRRLRPVAVVDTLARTTQIEMDLRLEAAAISEMAQNVRADRGFRVPEVDWQRTGKRILTLEWVDGIPIADKERLVAAGHDLEALGTTVLQSFLRHAMRDGFFHADMHQGNLFVAPDGAVVAVDFGIMGRLGPRERRFLAEILHGFISRDYRRAAEVHFWAGYVPPSHAVETFAQALRAVGEPIHGKPAEEISMASLLGQLFEYTEVFDMQTRPELLLLQKTMVAVEGVARGLDPALNIWTTAEPVVREWMERELGLEGRLKEAGEGAGSVGRIVGELPTLLAAAETTVRAVAEMATNGVRLDRATAQLLAEERRRSNLGARIALWIGVAALMIIAWKLAF